MAGITTAEPAGNGFAGLSEIYQYENADGKDPKTACGQAACATLLVYICQMSNDIDTLREIEKSHPADLLFGYWGSTPGRIEATLKHYKAGPLKYVDDFESLKSKVRAELPVVCLIQNTGTVWGIKDSAHWFVVYAYNNDGVFVTNYRSKHLSWSDFESKWLSPVTNLPIAFRGIAATARILNPRRMGNVT
jgi:hypothetical protein